MSIRGFVSGIEKTAASAWGEGKKILQTVEKKAGGIEGAVTGLANRIEGDVNAVVSSVDKEINKLGWIGEKQARRLDPELTPYPTTAKQRVQQERALQQRIAKPLAALSPSQRGIINTIHSKLGVSWVDLMHGSHVVVGDKGALYAKWKNLGARPRSSSHYPNVHVQQYETDFPGMGPLLFGKTGDGSTWFQMEGHPFGKDLMDSALHLGDYLIHVATGDMNVGPMGLSPHSEKTGKELHVAYKP